MSVIIIKTFTRIRFDMKIRRFSKCYATDLQIFNRRQRNRDSSVLILLLLTINYIPLYRVEDSLINLFNMLLSSHALIDNRTQKTHQTDTHRICDFSLSHTHYNDASIYQTIYIYIYIKVCTKKITGRYEGIFYPVLP